jgi:hypothetical protein
VLKSGNREENEERKTDSQITATPQEVKKETPPFRKPPLMKVASIKDVLEKNTQTVVSQTNLDASELPLIQNQESKQTQAENVTVIAAEKELNISEPEQEYTQEPEQEHAQEEETTYVTLQECWEDAIKASSTPNTIIVQELLLNQKPVETESQFIEINVPNEFAKQEIKEILPALTNCIQQMTGISYTVEINVVKVVQEKSIDKNNPDEKFKLLCQENPKLIEFIQRLNLSISS